MDRVVDVELRDRIATITLDSQHNRNALSRALLDGFHEALDRAEEAAARVVVVTHRGPAFCAGADLKERSAGPPDSTPFVRALERLSDADAITIAGVDGAVRAGGIGLMAACDLVVVNAATTFALTEVRIGVAPAIISVPILARVPPGRIAAAMLTGEPFDAGEARAMGLVTHVSDHVASTVSDLCAAVLRGGPAAVVATKRLLRSVPGLDRDTAFARMRALSDELFQAPEGAEGMRAFAEKRTPSWASADDETEER